MIHIGTSGFSYDDWVGPFYPEGTDKGDLLDYYAQHFDCNEVNYTYYRMPNGGTLAAMSAKTGPDFRFVIKANRTMTHEREEADEATFQEFIAALDPLREQSKFGCVLAQFPNSFKCTKQNVSYLRRFRELMPGVPVVLEFRNRGWIRDELWEFLREHDFGYCCVDQPQFSSLIPPIAEATSNIAYVRFHGRNYDKWWQHDEAWERYDYLYSEEELREWVPKVQSLTEQAEDTYLFFNNHYHAQAVQNAMQFAEMLEDADVS
ncbi:MAG: DUF72 domain-containing protein [Armatimonadota bacterium]|nr:DUF72 domain-containing protein [Armatimonadota bacterium]